MNYKRPSFTVRLLLLHTCAIALTSVAWAQSAPPSATPSELAKYDSNKNGVLDPSELAVMQADRQKAANVPVASPRAGGPEAESETVQLTPFEVRENDTKGYYASNAMSGTRLNTKLEDLAGSVSVITKQQLVDTAAIDINDIFSNELGTEGIKQYYDIGASTDARGEYDGVAGNPTGMNRVRGLSQATIAVGGFQASSSIPIDTYNIDAVEIARGANSSIAGLGDAGGVVNLRSARANLNRQTTNVTLRADDWGGFRASLDANQPVIRDLFSVRVSAMYEEKTWVRKPSLDRTDRQQIAFTLRPTKSTTLTGSYESFHEYANRANGIMPREGITAWRAAGSPTWDPVTQTFLINGVRTAPFTSLATVPAGVGKFGSANARNFQFIDGGAVQMIVKGGNPVNNANTPQQLLIGGLPTESRPLYRLMATNNDSVYDWHHINLAAPNYETNRADIFNLNLQQTLLRGRRQQLNFEAAWRREDQMNYRRMFVAQSDGVGNTISVNINERLLDGRPNPYLGIPYIGGPNPQVYTRPQFNDNYRAQLAYELDLRSEKNWMKWLGLHRVNGYGEYRLNLSSPSSLRYHDTITSNQLFVGTPTPTTDLSNNAGLLMYPFFYLGKTRGGNVEYGNVGATNWTGQQNAAVFASNAWSTNQQIAVEELLFSWGMQKKKIRTVGASIQSFLWSDRIVTTFGKRHDRQFSETNLNLPTVQSNFYYDSANLLNFGLNKRWREGDTATKGVVVKPFRGWSWTEGSSVGPFARALRGLSFHYNQSDSFQPQDAAYNLFLQELPNPTGQSKEYGFSLSAFDDKFVVRVTHQETKQSNSRTSGASTWSTRALAMDFDYPGQARTFDLYTSAQAWQRQLHPEFTDTQVLEAAARQIGYTKDFIDFVQNGTKIITDSSDAISKGWELELQFNPNRYWTTRVTGNQQMAVDSNISRFTQQFVAQRMPTWTTITAPDGSRWWTTPQGSDGSPEAFFTGSVAAPMNIGIANQGKRKPQDREYRAAVVTKYQLAGLGLSDSFLKNVSVGGTFRWASKAAIGYLAGAPDPDGIVRTLDPNKVIWDKSDSSVDLMAAYGTRLFRNRVRASFQLNVRNVTEDGRVKGVAVNPDGQFWQYRIIDPRQFILSASFDL